MTLIRIVLAVCGTATAVSAQTGDPLLRTLEARQGEWSQANAVLIEASRRLNPCSPRLTTLLTDVREQSAALARANAKFYEQYLRAARIESERDGKFAAETAAALNELQPVLDMVGQDRETVIDKRRQLTADATPEMREALSKLETAAAPSERPGAVSPDVSSKALRQSLDTKEKLLRDVESLTNAEFSRWTSYYNAVEAGIRRRCTQTQTGAEQSATTRRRRRK